MKTTNWLLVFCAFSVIGIFFITCLMENELHTVRKAYEQQSIELQAVKLERDSLKIELQEISQHLELSVATIQTLNDAVAKCHNRGALSFYNPE
ncbi:MAG: hypothetical protein ACOCVN_03465 [bacterium]